MMSDESIWKNYKNSSKIYFSKILGAPKRTPRPPIDKPATEFMCYTTVERSAKAIADITRVLICEMETFKNLFSVKDVRRMSLCSGNSTPTFSAKVIKFQYV